MGLHEVHELARIQGADAHRRFVPALQLVAANELPAVEPFYSGGLSGRWLKIANDEVQAIDPTFPGR